MDIGSIVKCVGYGVRDALAIPSSLSVVMSNESVRKHAAKCFLLNGIIFLGSIFSFEFVVKPILSYMASFGAPSTGGFFSFLSLTYYVAWVIPIYGLSFFLNSLWYQEIADTSYSFQVGKSTSSATKGGFKHSIGAKIADELFRTVLQILLAIQTFLFSFIPVVGPYISFIYVCWSYSLYCFEYKWINKGWNLTYRLEYFERHWAYLAGFGVPFASFTFFWSTFVSGGLFALFFPLFIVMANYANPTAPAPEELAPGLQRVPIFSVAKRITNQLSQLVLGAQRR